MTLRLLTKEQTAIIAKTSLSIFNVDEVLEIIESSRVNLIEPLDIIGQNVVCFLSQRDVSSINTLFVELLERNIIDNTSINITDPKGATMRI